MQDPFIIVFIATGILLAYAAFVVARSRGQDESSPTPHKPPIPTKSQPETFEPAELARIEAYLAGKKRTRDLALLFLVHETSLPASDVARLTLGAGPGGEVVVVTAGGQALELSTRASQHVSRWVADKQFAQGELLFTRIGSGKPMQPLQIEGLIRKWRWKTRVPA